MANQKICDRCGKPINNPNYILWLIMPYKPGDDSRYPFERMTRDLCEDCVSSLVDWMLCIDSEDKRKFIEALVDKGCFDRTHDISAKDLKKFLEGYGSVFGTDEKKEK